MPPTSLGGPFPDSSSSPSSTIAPSIVIETTTSFSTFTPPTSSSSNVPSTSALVLTTASTIPSSIVPVSTTAPQIVTSVITESATNSGTPTVNTIIIISTASVSGFTATSSATRGYFSTGSLSSTVTSFTPIPPVNTSPTLAKSAQIGLGVGIPLGALIFMGLGGLLVFYFLRLRQRNRTSPVDTMGDNDYGIEVDPGFEDSRRPELEDTDTRMELDGEHWRRELPATRRSSKSMSQNAKRITTNSGRSRQNLPAAL